eukprot:SAG31_NODE_9198_length_1317_cov_1.651888_1_plen_136_part_00
MAETVAVTVIVTGTVTVTVAVTVTVPAKVTVTVPVTVTVTVTVTATVHRYSCRHGLMSAGRRKPGLADMPSEVLARIGWHLPHDDRQQMGWALADEHGIVSNQFIEAAFDWIRLLALGNNYQHDFDELNEMRMGA